MSYTLTPNNGQNPIVVLDGKLDNSTNLTFVGRNIQNYGGLIDQNFLSLLENFANSTAPVRPITGQLWYNTTTNQLNVYNGQRFKNVTSCYTSSISPLAPNVGDMWLDTGNLGNPQVRIWIGATWFTVGSGGANGTNAETIRDVMGSNHHVLSFNIDNTRYAILSADQEFIPQNSIGGFSRIAPGLNLVNQNFVTNNRLTGQVSDSFRLGGLYSNNYMRTDINTGTRGSLSVTNNLGINMGAFNQVRMNMQSNNLVISNSINNANISIITRDSGANYTSFSAQGANINMPGRVTIGQNFRDTAALSVFQDFGANGPGYSFSVFDTVNSLFITPRLEQYEYFYATQDGDAAFFLGNLNIGLENSLIIGKQNSAHIRFDNSTGGMQLATNLGEQVTINYDGKVGINTTQPVNKLTIQSANVAGLAIAQNWNNPWIYGAGQGTAAVGVRFSRSNDDSGATGTMADIYAGNEDELGNYYGYLAFATRSGPSENDMYQAAKIDSDGNFVVGSSNKFAPVIQSVQVEAPNQQLFLRHSRANVGAYWGVGPYNTYSNFSILNNANLGVYISNGQTSWTANSDERIKADLLPITDATEKVAGLRAMTGRYTQDEPGISRSFLIAQDVLKVFPQAVTVPADPAEPLGLSYTDVIPLLVAAIQELQAQVDQLKSQQ
jgi:hypothetical protein